MSEARKGAPEPKPTENIDARALTVLAKPERAVDDSEGLIDIKGDDVDTAFDSIMLTPEEAEQFSGDEIDQIFKPAGWDSTKIQKAIEQETQPRIDKIEEDIATIPNGDALKGEKRADLESNDEKAHRVALEENEEVQALLNGILALSGDLEGRATQLATIAGLYPKKTLDAIRQFGLSHDEIVKFAEAVPANQRGRLFEALGVPLVKKDGPQKSPEALVEAIESPEHLEGKELIRKFEYVSRDLALAIEEEFPERAALDAEVYDKEQILQGKILNSRELGAAADEAVTRPLLLDIEGSTLPAICKPQGRETPIINGRKILVRNGIEAGGMAKREALVSLINRALGYNMVPTTVLREGPEGIGSVQEWTTGQIPRNRPDEEGGWEAAQDREQLQRIGFMDHLIARSDGHPGNWIVGFDGKAMMIDNGSAFAKQTNPLDRMYSVPLMVVNGDNAPADMKDGAAKFLTSFKTKESLRQAFHGLLGRTEGEQFWQEFIGRLEEATRDDFKLPDTAITFEQQLAFVETGMDFSRKDAEEYVRQQEAETNKLPPNNP